MIKGVWTPSAEEYIQVYTTSESGPGENAPLVWNTSRNAVTARTSFGDVDVGTQLGIDFTPKTLEILKWVEAKMQQEKEMKELVEEYPALKDAHNAFMTIYYTVGGTIGEVSIV